MFEENLFFAKMHIDYRHNLK